MIFLTLLLALSSRADPQAGQRVCHAMPAGPDPCSAFSSSPAAPGQAPLKTAADGYRYVQDCARGKNWQRVEQSADMQRLLKGFARGIGQNLPVYSCFRSQQSQDEILCRNHCAPCFGGAVCEGRVAANLSEHTAGIAADIMVQTQQGPQSSRQQLRAEAFRMCGLLDQNRKLNNNGWGGITVYGVEPKDGKAFLHMDVKKDWCNWGTCQEMPSLGEGNCKRTKYRNTEAKLMQRIADAKRDQANADVRRIEALLQQLRAACAPGDNACRDLYKSL